MIPPEELTRRLAEPGEREPSEPQPGEVMRIGNFVRAWQTLKEIDPANRELATLEPPGYVPSEADVVRIEDAARKAAIQRVCDFLRPDGQPIGREGTSSYIRELPGGLQAAQRDFDYLSTGSDVVEFAKGWMARMPFGGGTITFRPVSSSPGSPAVDINIQDLDRFKLHY